MQIFILMIVWVGVWLGGFTDFGVGAGLGMTFGMLIQWGYGKGEM